jgi:hypothetical protein
MYASKLLNLVDKYYIATKKEALAMGHDLHKFRHYLLGNQIIFYVDHMALVYLVDKPQVFGQIVKCYYYFWNMTSRLFINCVDPI